MHKMLGVRIDPLTKQEILEKAKTWLSGSETHTLYTPNPEMLVAAHRNLGFRDILNSGDMNVCDGFGIQLMSGGVYTRFPGADLVLSLCELAEREGKSVYFIGGKSGAAKQAAEKLKERFAGLSIHFVQKSDNITIKQCDNRAMYTIVDKGQHDEILSDIVLAKPDILFVAFGHGKQEWWIDTFKSELPGVKILMGVGGTFDFLAGVIPRAPKLFRRIGIEWLWRLIHQPSRIKRIFTAVIVFPYLVLKSYVVK
ncbi:MAG: N-acetylmannosaminyltransferase TagA [Candidatus Magasanikbacteria bacterium GW2011_GWD2_43_18]|uniref:N-acetylmannosaminyltransferase TagA n=1 Tax=Candidatus Magasanikbacteria bacterium GW2011_GWE2_42_7 TaxID=1619052 RepID=A0A0G1DQE3_9BACT|nr:MAG: N-acetylmannosaminyltransferase TagA [Candidatus Magasanikbacteria bacterium GW2011_GWC2_42_27]KKS73041.1 MAG: N-acetylmannosaminyltransferase TagA [Candidatus Magasanikbacteria bacterium GW2011_GWE2_42_7]KKT03973.1 MAG: N-acetylmannosaminyltransferase TagA [Candidatus Magasanikbacteria bacterium GW2011_GWD2_43_18]KKT25544.1 MAG: N-acetylmannosaminyltransferase TagA [Candidatus Magasanikbacteria bacterium GW2011_GWA2_43_9]HBB37725.1 hypothetical protein [Candidatus Magasanikbacteria bac